MVQVAEWVVACISPITHTIQLHSTACMCLPAGPAGRSLWSGQPGSLCRGRHLYCTMCSMSDATMQIPLKQYITRFQASLLDGVGPIG